MEVPFSVVARLSSLLQPVPQNPPRRQSLSRIQSQNFPRRSNPPHNANQYGQQSAHGPIRTSAWRERSHSQHSSQNTDRFPDHRPYNQRRGRCFH